MAEHFIGVDVGTGSARAGVFDAVGTMLASAKADIRLWREAGDMVEQSSNDIWRAACSSVCEAVAAAGVSPRSVAGLGFDATCSLVVLGKGGQSVAVGPSGDPERNVIVWMDHRATDQARRITIHTNPRNADRQTASPVRKIPSDGGAGRRRPRAPVPRPPVGREPGLRAAAHPRRARALERRRARRNRRQR